MNIISSQAWVGLVGHYGYLAVFVLSFVEGPLVTIFAAALAAQGLLQLWPVYGMVLAGDITGDLAYYAAGRWVIAPLAQRAGYRTGTLASRVERLRRHLHERVGRVLLFGKLTHSAGFIILLASGAARVRLAAYLFYNLLGTVPKAALLMAVGYFFGRFYTEVGGPFKTVSVAVFVIVLAAVFFLVRRIWSLPENITDGQ